MKCLHFPTVEGARQNAFVDQGSGFIASKVNVSSQPADPQEKRGYRKLESPGSNL
jgi:hypothetical protein